MDQIFILRLFFVFFFFYYYFPLFLFDSLNTSRGKRCLKALDKNAKERFYAFTRGGGRENSLHNLISFLFGGNSAAADLSPVYVYTPR